MLRYKNLNPLVLIIATISLLVVLLLPVRSFADNTSALPACGTDKCTTAVPVDCGTPAVKDSSGNIITPATQSCDDNAIANNKIVTNVINPAIKVFTVLVGVVAVIMFIIAGIIYSSAGDDPNRIKLAKKIIVDVVIGIVAYVFLFAFLNYILPQGIG